MPESRDDAYPWRSLFVLRFARDLSMSGFRQPSTRRGRTGHPRTRLAAWVWLATAALHVDSKIGVYDFRSERIQPVHRQECLFVQHLSVRFPNGQADVR